jgi:hypothetical protein
MQNIEKALELLNVPAELSMFNGQLQKKTTYQIVETITTDRTNVEVTTDPVTGKQTARRVTKITREYASAPSRIEKFGGYGLNVISGWINGFGYDYVGVNAEGKDELFRDEEDKLVTEGDFAGQTFHFNWVRIPLIKTDSGAIMEFIWDQGRNTNSAGFPIANELDFPVTIQRIQKVISGTVSIKANGTYTVSNVSTTTSRPTSVSVTKGYLLQNMSVDENELAEMCKVVFEVKDQDDETHVENLACDIVVTGDKVKGDVYINGIDSENIPYTTLIASMGLKFPQFVQRWHLYNGVVNNSVYGSTVTIQLSASESNEIQVVAGDSFSWNPTTKVLTYDQSKPADLWYTFECLPAQGKNEGAQVAIDLKTGLKKVL